MRGARSGAMAMAAVLLVAACGSKDDDGAASVETTPASAIDGDDDATEPTDAEPPGASARPEVVVGESGRASEASITAAVRIVVVHGDKAGIAVVIALDRGYEAEQVIAAAGADALLNNGIIDGEPPLGVETALFVDQYDPVQQSFRRHPREVIALDDIRTLLAEAATRAEELGRSDDAAGVIALILDLARAGYDLEQITEMLSAPESFRLAEHTADERTMIGPIPRSCDFVLGPGDETVLPRTRPTDSWCRVVYDAVFATRVERLPAQITSGPVINASTVNEVVVNQLTFRYDPSDNTVALWGAVDRDVSLVGVDDCVDHKISPLSIYSGSVEYDPGTGTFDSTFSYRVAAERFRSFGDSSCEDANKRFGRGTGTLEGAYDPDIGVVAGTLTFPGGLGVAEFESDDS